MLTALDTESLSDALESTFVNQDEEEQSDDNSDKGTLSNHSSNPINLKQLCQISNLTDCVIKLNHSTLNFSKFYLSYRSQFFYEFYKTQQTAMLDLTECAYDDLILTTVLDFIHFDVQETDLIKWLTKGLPIDQLYEASNYFKVHDLTSMIHKVIALFGNNVHNHLKNPNDVIHLLKSIDGIITNPAFDWNWIEIFIQNPFQYLNWSEMILEKVDLNSYLFLLTINYPIWTEQEKFQSFLVGYQNRGSMEQKLIKDRIRNEFQLNKIQPLLLLKMFTTIEELESILKTPTDPAILNYPIHHAKRFTQCPNIDVVARINFNYQDMEFVAQLEHSYHSHDFKGVLLRFDLSFIKINQKIPHFVAILLDSTTFRPIKTYNSFSNHHPKDLDYEKGYFGNNSFIERQHLIDGREYIFIIKFFGFITFLSSQ